MFVSCLCDVSDNVSSCYRTGSGAMWGLFMFMFSFIKHVYIIKKEILHRFLISSVSALELGILNIFFSLHLCDC